MFRLTNINDGISNETKICDVSATRDLINTTTHVIQFFEITIYLISNLTAETKNTILLKGTIFDGKSFGNLIINKLA